MDGTGIAYAVLYHDCMDVIHIHQGWAWPGTYPVNPHMLMCVPLFI